VAVLTKASDMTNIPSTTTSEQDLRTASQRKVNLIWELTQASIAIGVVISNIVYVFTIIFVGELSAQAASASALLANAFFLVIGFYFGRTNHARIGDIGKGGLDDRPS
jgi:hypothetical protein